MGDVRDSEQDQPLPLPNGRCPIADLVIADHVTRREHGVRKYGAALQPFNGRDATQDAYEEALDLSVYLRQLLEEEKVLDHYFMYASGDVECDRCSVSLLMPYENIVPLGELLWRVKQHERKIHSADS